MCELAASLTVATRVVCYRDLTFVVKSGKSGNLWWPTGWGQYHQDRSSLNYLIAEEKENESIKNAFSCCVNTEKLTKISGLHWGKKPVSRIHLQEGKNWFLVDERILAIPMDCSLLKSSPT